MATADSASPDIQPDLAAGTAETRGPSPARSTPPTLTWTRRVSEPVEDTVYPDVGDPGVDALHYELDLTWDPARRRPSTARRP